MGNPKILDLLINAGASDSTSIVGNISPTANSILASAVIHQENASESRIGVQVRKGVAKPETAGLPRFKSLSKSAVSGAVSITAERKMKKTDWVQQQSTMGPKFSIALWKSQGVQDKPKQVESDSSCIVALHF
jgi:hypothetical protein